MKIASTEEEKMAVIQLFERGVKVQYLVCFPWLIFKYFYIWILKKTNFKKTITRLKIVPIALQPDGVNLKTFWTLTS